LRRKYNEDLSYRYVASLIYLYQFISKFFKISVNVNTSRYSAFEIFEVLKNPVNHYLEKR